MSRTGQKIEGVLTELPVPFRDDLSIDYESLSRIVDSQAAAGISGLYLHGVAGETVFLSAEEEVELLRQCVNAADGRLPVIANVLGSGQVQAVQRARTYERAGVDLLSISQPLFYTYDEPSLLNYFSAVIEAVDVPVLIYNMPSAGYTLSPGLVGALSQKYDRVVGYKDSTQNIIHLQNVVAQANKQGFAVYAGSDATIHATLCAGGAGVISMISMLFPEEVIKLYQRHCAGDIAGAFAQQEFLLKLRSALKAAPLIAGYKTAAKRLGLYTCDAVRPPLACTDARAEEALMEKLHGLGIMPV